MEDWREENLNLNRLDYHAQAIEVQCDLEVRLIEVDGGPRSYTGGRKRRKGV